jgi:hypothetical protein
MGGDASVAHADDGMRTTEAADRRATTARLAFVARHVGVVEIGTASALQQVAGCGRHVAQLARRTGEQCPRQQAIVAAHARIGGKIGVADQGADPQAALGRDLDLVE